MKTLVLYESAYGSSKRYAQWIAQALHADLRKTGEADAALLSQYDTVVCGGGLYAGKIGGAKTLVKEKDTLAGKKIAFFTVGLARVEDPSVFARILEQSFPEDLRNQIRFFHFRGAMDVQELRPIHRAMMAAMKQILLKKEKKGLLTDDDRGMLAIYQHPADFTDETAIAPLIRWITAE